MQLPGQEEGHWHSMHSSPAMVRGIRIKSSITTGMCFLQSLPYYSLCYLKTHTGPRRWSGQNRISKQNHPGSSLRTKQRLSPPASLQSQPGTWLIPQ